jgi:hypothetical protein
MSNGLISNFSAPKDIQRAALKWLAKNGPSHSSAIAYGISSGSLWNIGQNLSVLKKSKLVSRDPHTAVWTITTAGAVQAHAWAVADGDISDVTEEPQYIWEIAYCSVGQGGIVDTGMDASWEPFSADGTKRVFFRRLVEKK